MVKESLNEYCRMCRSYRIKFCVRCKEMWKKYHVPMFFHSRNTRNMKYCIKCKENIPETPDPRFDRCKWCVKYGKMLNPSNFSIKREISLQDGIYFSMKLLEAIYPSEEISLELLKKKIFYAVYKTAIDFLRKAKEPIYVDEDKKTIIVSDIDKIYKKYKEIVAEIIEYESMFWENNAVW